MQLTFLRLALSQLVVIVYSILVVGVLLKVRFGSPAPLVFATFLRDYGFLLLILPAAWLVWAGLSSHRPRADTGDASSILLCGVCVLGFLVLLAVAGTVSVFSYHSLLVAVPDHPAATDSP